jgi:hypothetical protein
MQIVDRAFDDLFQGRVGHLNLVEGHRNWRGTTLTFSFTAKMGWIGTPIKGTVEVTDRDVTIDADLGLLEHLIPATKAREVLGDRVRGLLK